MIAEAEAPGDRVGHKPGALAGTEVQNKMSIIIDREKYLVIKDNKSIELPRKEFELLRLLSTVPGKVFSRRQIFEKVWGDKSSSNERTVDVHIVNIRKKLGNELIRTIKGVGYKITVNEIEIKDFK